MSDFFELQLEQAQLGSKTQFAQTVPDILASEIEVAKVEVFDWASEQNFID